MQQFDIGKTVLTINPSIFVAGALFSIVTVIISCKKPAKIASKVSPIEAVRYTEASTLKKKNRKTHRNNPFHMAMANMVRNRGKTAVVVTSLTLAVLILQMTVTFTNGFDMEKYLKHYSVSDFLVGDVDYLNHNKSFDDEIALSQQEIDTLTALDGVTQHSAVYGTTKPHYFFYERKALDNYLEFMTTYASEELLKNEEKIIESMGTNNENQVLLNTTLYGMDDSSLDKITVFEGSVENIAEKNGIVALYMADDYGVPIPDSSSRKIGDTVTARYVDTWEYFDIHTDEKIVDFGTYEVSYYRVPLVYTDVDYTVVALATMQGKMGYRGYSKLGELFILPVDILSQSTAAIAPMNLLLDVEEGKTAEIDAFLTDYTTTVNTSLDFESQERLAEEFASFKNMFFMVGMLLSILIGCIGVLNFFNVILTSISVRKKELAMLSSIGMTGKQLKTMLVFESLFYLCITMVITCVLAVLCVPALNRVIGSMFWFFTGHFTILPLLIVFPIFLIIGIGTPLAVYHSLSKQSIVERLRETQ